MEKKGRSAAICYALSDSPLGRLLVARSEAGLSAIAFGDTDRELVQDLHHRYPEASLHPPPKGLEAELKQVFSWFQADPGEALPALDVAGTAFERRVWEAMRRIPRGATVEYGQFAADLGMPRALRAVGAAIGKNPLALLYPCHRLVARGGKLHRYRWGLARKELLLAMERIGTGQAPLVPQPEQGQLSLGQLE